MLLALRRLAFSLNVECCLEAVLSAMLLPAQQNFGTQQSTVLAHVGVSSSTPFLSDAQFPFFLV